MLNARQTQALHSVREAEKVIKHLTEDEVLEALAFEKKTLKRKHVVSLLISRAIHFYKSTLEK